MTDPTLVATAVGAALVTVIGSLTAGVVTVINALAAAKERIRASAQRAALSEKVDSSLRKADEIHVLVNGSATAAQQKMIALESQVTALHAAISLIQGQRVEDAKQQAAMSRRPRAEDVKGGQS